MESANSARLAVLVAALLSVGCVGEIEPAASDYARDGGVESVDHETDEAGSTSLAVSATRSAFYSPGSSSQPLHVSSRTGTRSFGGEARVRRVRSSAGSNYWMDTRVSGSFSTGIPFGGYVERTSWDYRLRWKGSAALLREHRGNEWVIYPAQDIVNDRRAGRTTSTADLKDRYGSVHLLAVINMGTLRWDIGSQPHNLILYKRSGDIRMLYDFDNATSPTHSRTSERESGSRLFIKRNDYGLIYEVKVRGEEECVHDSRCDRSGLRSCEEGRIRCTSSGPECRAVPKPAGRQCRSAAHQCDAVEYCNGSSSRCPSDRDDPDGTHCEIGSTNGTCLSGVCSCAGLARPIPTSPQGEMTHVGCAPGNPCLVGLCTRNACDAGETPTYTWRHERDATWYEIFVNPGERTKWYRASDVCRSGTCSVRPAWPMAAGTRARWWVRGWNDPCKHSAWSAGMAFTVR